MTLIPVAEAQARVIGLGRALPVESASLIEAALRYAAEDILALRTQPAVDLSAMDGYAIRFAELPGPWRVVGESAAGAGLGRALNAGEAARIFTGAPLPEGADTVMVQEEAAREGDVLRLAGEGPGWIGRNVRPAASDFATATRLIAAGELLTPARVGLAAIGGHGALPVRRRPRIALLSTGDELVPPGAAVQGVQIPASNGVMLSALLAATPALAEEHPIVPDDLDAMVAAFDRARDADIIVTIGGASVGDYDLVRPALLQAGATLDFWRVALKPGKPLMAGRLGDAVVLGLPGNPVSALVTAQLFLLPLVAAMLGASDPVSAPRAARLLTPLPSTGERAEYLRAVIEPEGVRPLTAQDSAALLALALADALIVRPPASPAVAAGEIVEILGIA